MLMGMCEQEKGSGKIMLRRQEKGGFAKCERFCEVVQPTLHPMAAGTPAGPWVSPERNLIIPGIYLSSEQLRGAAKARQALESSNNLA